MLLLVGLLVGLLTLAGKNQCFPIAACGQFHQHFMSAFCTNILAPKKVQTLNISTKKLSAKLLYKKAAHIIVVKLTPHQPFLTQKFEIIKKSIGLSQEEQKKSSTDFHQCNIGS